jgi:hypothetical protein
MVPNHDFVQLVSEQTRNARLGWLPAAFAARPAEERMLVKVILGHEVNKETHKLVPGKIPRHVLFLREPAESLVSYYNHQMKQRRLAGEPLLDFEQWYDESKRDNMMTRWMRTHFMMEADPGKMRRRELDQVQETLRAFWFVGCTQYLDRDAPLLFRRIGVAGNLERANVAGADYERTLSLNTSLRERVRAENPLDVELYEFWEARLEQTLEKIRAEVRDQLEARPVP